MLNLFGKLLGASIVEPQNDYSCENDPCSTDAGKDTLYEYFPSGSRYERGCC